MNLLAPLFGSLLWHFYRDCDVLVWLLKLRYYSSPKHTLRREHGRARQAPDGHRRPRDFFNFFAYVTT